MNGVFPPLWSAQPATPPEPQFRDPAQAGPAPPVGQAPPVDHDRVRADAYATIAANPASEEAHAAREVLARLPKVAVGGGLGPGSVEEPDHTMMVANYMRGMR